MTSIHSVKLESTQAVSHEQQASIQEGKILNGKSSLVSMQKKEASFFGVLWSKIISFFSWIFCCGSAAKKHRPFVEKVLVSLRRNFEGFSTYDKVVYQFWNEKGSQEGVIPREEMQIQMEKSVREFFDAHPNQEKFAVVLFGFKENTPINYLYGSIDRNSRSRFMATISSKALTDEDRNPLMPKKDQISSDKTLLEEMLPSLMKRFNFE